MAVVLSTDVGTKLRILARCAVLIGRYGSARLFAMSVASRCQLPFRPTDRDISLAPCVNQSAPQQVIKLAMTISQRTRNT